MIIVDTSILVDILRKKARTLEFMQGLGATMLFTTEITFMELVYGITGSKNHVDNPELKQKRLTEIQDTCSRFSVLSFDRKAAMKTAEIMGKLKLEGKLVDFRDGMIAGTGLANGINELLTLNPEHFRRIKELKVITINQR
ncbi:MAG: type II toxin-antitoxin system VapC family toxin [Candidatus Hodarchaeales archaeon]